MILLVILIIESNIYLSIQDETDFWNKLIERYLKPVQDPKSHLEHVERELKSLRNKVTVLTISDSLP